MEDELKEILYNYISEVNRLCEVLLKELELINKSELIKYLYMGDKRIWELNINNITYKFHGSGCNAYYENQRIQWDFGRRSHWCGIDPWFISCFIKDTKNNFSVYFDSDYIKIQCEKAVKEKIMYAKDGKYYFEIPLKDTFAPQFPKDFDLMVIEYYNKKWVIPKDKELIRFIRKSTFVYNGIYNFTDKYILTFQKNKQNIFSIPYNDICYPENAVKIMSDRIIRNMQ